MKDLMGKPEKVTKVRNERFHGKIILKKENRKENHDLPTKHTRFRENS